MSGLKALFEMPFSSRQRKLASSRPAISESDFVDRTASSDLGRAAATSLWKKLQDVKVRDELTPYPDDDLLRVYGLADEDLDEDIILAVIKEVGASVPSREVVTAFGPVRTPLDVVRLVESCSEGAA